MHNLSSHKVPAVRTATEAAGVKLMFLPPCRLDFNPIEMAFSKLRQHSVLRGWRRGGSNCIGTSIKCAKV